MYNSDSFKRLYVNVNTVLHCILTLTGTVMCNFLELLYPRLVEMTVPDKFNADSCCYDAEIPPELLKKCKKATSVTLGKE